MSHQRRKARGGARSRHSGGYDGRKRVMYYIFRAWVRDPKTGEQRWARDHGLKAWRIPVYAE